MTQFNYQGRAAGFSGRNAKALPVIGRCMYSFPVPGCEEVGDEPELGKIALLRHLSASERSSLVRNRLAGLVTLHTRQAGGYWLRRG